MYDLRDVADELTDAELDNDRFCAIHDLFTQLGADIPEMHPGAYTDDELADLADACRDWADGNEPTLIEDGPEFVDYARELAEDCGLIPDNAEWPTRCIDWEQAARELQMDYTPVSFDGRDYLIRL